MRSFLAAVLAVSLGWAGGAAAQSPYGDDDDPDENPTYDAPAPVPTPPPPPPAAAVPAAPAAPLPAPPDDQQAWRYNGPHAVNAQYGTGFCSVQGAHTHPYPPFDDHLVQEQDGGYNFLGDPVDFGYAGSDVYWYSAAHPIASGWGVGWCFMGWGHRHLYRPWGPYFSTCGSYFCYAGPYDAYYWRWRGYWTPYWGSYYPRYYRGGIYARSRVAASPGRWGRVGVRRPGGYARPVPGRRPGALRGHASPYSRLPHSTPPRHVPGTRVAPTPHAGPRMTGPRMTGPRMTAPRMTAPTRLAPTPRSYTAPRMAPPTRLAPTPRTYSPPRSSSTPRFSAPRGLSAPRSSAPPRSSSPARSSGGGRRR